MNFDFNETQTMFRDMVRDFAKQEIAPIAQQMDEEGTMPDELITKMAANGFFGLSFPEQYGGLGVDTITYALVIEELAKASAGVCVMLTVHNSVGSYPLAMYGSEEVWLLPPARKAMSMCSMVAKFSSPMVPGLPSM